MSWGTKDFLWVAALVLGTKMRWDKLLEGRKIHISICVASHWIAISVAHSFKWLTYSLTNVTLLTMSFHRDQNPRILNSELRIYPPPPFSSPLSTKLSNQKLFNSLAGKSKALIQRLSINYLASLCVWQGFGDGHIWYLAPAPEIFKKDWLRLRFLLNVMISSSKYVH